MEKHQIIETADGSSTLRSPIFGELYHSDRGAIGEAEHVFIRFLRPGVRVFEVGFGTGLNALLTMRTGMEIRYTAIELYPIDMETARSLSFADNDLTSLHEAPWGERCHMSERFSILKIEGDLVKQTFEASSFDMIFFDAFAPDVVPQMWSREVFSMLFEALAPGGELLTYSAKGSVKQALRDAGFEIERLPGALGKRHMLRAIKGVKV